ncbi:secondary thiamine-phosphate synthase enzyme YjbQ [Anoxynatronum buryatiense]|uniref:Secondary thiamine-phosphate synthase enzyme n=1 Tax=Anoxynatronum buryatiense TaxID=489973 RepID=A0AA46AKD0_9CLOT|nr:secondary thiamine-phosphate synthase enzyme YjbQ [Anoxynatronum buryatiense]SMP69516.1 secondary thiamine-phosphate synthase enzyme [Anoxynatronum buryatiense]
MIELNLTTRHRDHWLEITGEVERIIEQHQWKDGTVIIYVPHTTAGVTINENADAHVTADLIQVLQKLVPWEDNYRHAEGNTAAHLKASLMGASQTLLVKNGRWQRGTWQGLYFCEFDGPRQRKIWIQFQPVINN